MQKRSSSVEILDATKAGVVTEFFNLNKIIELPAELDYFSDEGERGKLQLKTGFNRQDERYHVNRFFDMDPATWTRLLASL